jgi:hypothetical protein
MGADLNRIIVIEKFETNCRKAAIQNYILETDRRNLFLVYISLILYTSILAKILGLCYAVECVIL